MGRLASIIVLLVITIGAKAQNDHLQGIKGSIKHINMFYTEHTWIDHDDSTEGDYPLHEGLAVFTDEIIWISYKLKPQHNSTTIDFTIDSINISITDYKWKQIIFWIHPEDDLDYGYPEKLVLFHNNKKWASYLYLDSVILYFDGRL